MFSIEEELKTIETFRPMSIIRAIICSMETHQVKEIRSYLEPHWSDDYNPPLDPFFTINSCKLCLSSVINRKKHFHTECEEVKKLRRESNSIEEFENGAKDRIAAVENIKPTISKE